MSQQANLVLKWLSANWSTIVPMVLSLAALLVALGSWRQNKKLAVAARDSYRLEQQRQHNERAPHLSAEYFVAGKSHDRHAIRLDHDGPINFDLVEVTIEAAAGERQAFTMFQHSDGPTSQIEPLQVGDRPDALIDAPDPRFGGRVRLNCRCVSGDDEWEVPVIVDVKPSAGRFSGEMASARIAGWATERPRG